MGITTIICYNNKIFSSIKKRLVAAAKFLVAATKKIFVVFYFAAVTKPFSSVEGFHTLKINLKLSEVRFRGHYCVELPKLQEFLEIGAKIFSCRFLEKCLYPTCGVRFGTYRYIFYYACSNQTNKNIAIIKKALISKF